ncbi:MAG: hypothetical protein GY853_16790, partial [PVC group bacterium]|nr:hypothetical protein [PVC group bacterium]
TALHKKTKVPLSAFLKYREKACHIAEKRVRQCRVMHCNLPVVPWTLQSKCELANLTKLYVTACADKAAGNFVFVCKKYYFLVLSTELGISITNGKLEAEGNATYKTSSESLHNILGRHKFIARKLSLSIADQDMVLPMLFAIPKMHKNPIKFRFIAGAKHSSTKSLSLKIAKILSFCKCHFENYCSAISHNSGRVLKWSIKNSLSAVNVLKNIGNVSSMITADFSTSYMSLPHTVIKESLFYLVSLLFKNSGKEFLVLGYPNYYYADYPHSEFKSLNKQEICELITFVLENTYVTFAGFI